MCKWNLYFVILLLFSNTAVPSLRAADQKLEAVIEAVRKNERLYDNLEVRQHLSYTQAGTQPSNSRSSNEQLLIFDHQTTDTHFVSQDNLFRVDRRGMAKSGDRVIPLNRIRSFDGMTTRVLEVDKHEATIIGRAEDETFIRPHMQLLQKMQFLVPLSTYLSGDQAMREYPGAQWATDNRLDVLYKGEDELDGLRCHQVWVTTIIEGNYPHDRWEMWLAEDRNYIPIRIVGYTFRMSKTVSVCDSRVQQWQEVGKDVWYPVKCSVTAFDQMKVAATGEQVVSWQQEFTSDNVSLNPKHDLAYFQDAPFKAKSGERKRLQVPSISDAR